MNIGQISESRYWLIHNRYFFNTDLRKTNNIDRIFLAHIQHIRDVAGIDHVGIGADFCGVTLTPEGAEDVSKYPIVFAVLLEQGWTAEELGKLASNNLIRVLREVEIVRDDLAQMEPMQNWIPEEDYSPEEKSCKSGF